LKALRERDRRALELGVVDFLAPYIVPHQIVFVQPLHDDNDGSMLLAVQPRVQGVAITTL